MRRALRVAAACGVVLVCAMAIVMVAGATGGAIALDQDRGTALVSVDGDSTEPVDPPDFASTERMVLSPSEQNASGEAAAMLEPTMATSISFAKMEAQYDTYALQEEMAATNDPDTEIELIEQELTRIEADIGDRLDAEEETYEDYVAGHEDSQEAIHRLALLHLEAEITQERLDGLAEALRDTSPLTQSEAQGLRGQVSQAHLEARTIQGPVSEQVAMVMIAEESSMQPVRIDATDGGYVLTAVDNGVFLRESLIADNRERGSGAGFTDIDAARELTADLYPWTVAESLESEDVPRGEIYASNTDHPHGTTSIYIDSATELPFRDAHQLDLFSMPTVEAINQTTDDVHIVVERTYAGGPTQVAVMDAESGEPLEDAQLLIEDQQVADTEYDGAWWFVAPDRTFDLTVLVAGDEVELTVELPG